MLFSPLVFSEALTARKEKALRASYNQVIAAQDWKLIEFAEKTLDDIYIAIATNDINFDC